MKIFICYRREDSEETAARIYDRLTEAYGREAVFKDVDTIPLPVKFAEFISDWLQDASLVLVLIGPDWLTVKDSRGVARLSDPEDFVRLEIVTALSLPIPLIPVAVRRSTLPNAAALPDGIGDLAKWNGVSVRPDPDFHGDVDRLLLRIRELTGVNEGQQILRNTLIANHHDRIRFALQNTSDYPVHVTHVRFCFRFHDWLTANPDDDVKEDAWGRISLPPHAGAFWAIRATQLRAMDRLMKKPLEKPLEASHLSATFLLSMDSHRTRRLQQEMPFPEEFKLTEKVAKHIEDSGRD